MADARDRARPPAWDTTRMETHRCDVVNASEAGGTVTVHFGRRAAREDGALGVDQVRSVRLTPYSAKRLQELLAVLVRDHDQRRSGGV